MLQRSLRVSGMGAGPGCSLSRLRRRMGYRCALLRHFNAYVISQTTLTTTSPSTILRLPRHTGPASFGMGGLLGRNTHSIRSSPFSFFSRFSSSRSSAFKRPAQTSPSTACFQRPSKYRFSHTARALRQLITLVGHPAPLPPV